MPLNCLVEKKTMIDYKKRPPVKPFGEFRLDCPKPLVLPNGVPLYVVSGCDQDVNRLDVIHRGGMFEEMPHRLLAQSTASQLSQGTSRMTSQEVAECFDFNGSWIGSRCSYNHTTVSLNSLNRCFDNTLPVLRDIIFEPSFPEREFRVYQNRCLSAYRTARERVKYIAGVEINKIYFGLDYPLSSVVSDDDVLAIDTGLLGQFHRRYFRAANRTLILSGSITDREIGMVTEAFGKDFDDLDAEPLADATRCGTGQHFSVVEKPGAVQSAICMQLPAVPRVHPDYFKLRILVTALGGYFGSRLMSNVREDKGYTYGIWASLVGTRTDAYVSISTECDCDYVSPLIDEVRREMDRLKHEPIPAEELEMVKSSMLSDLVKNLDTPFAIASNVSAMLLYDIYPEYFNEQIKAIRSVAPEELQEVAQRYFIDDRLYIAVAGRM